ncbi:MAG: HDOD domain-containing protein [Clostridium sp.]|nr:HDOD domain-containing protein [Acetatifactor muris]MCM1526124.1 HDOD domain-containing protein [Bacteroides sp.]MCM1562728.1 HDOD domain-containing protein [Clostridium sp.]
MLAVLIPLFDENMAVSAYSIFTQKHNYLLNPAMLGTGQHDGAARVEGLELIRSVGIETLSDGKEIFVPVTNISVLADLEAQCDAPPEQIVFLIDNTVPPVEMYIDRLKQLKEEGFKLAIRKLAVSEFESYREILALMDYVFLNNRKIAIDKAKIYFGKLFPSVKLCAGNIDTNKIFESLKETGGYSLYEGNFYRLPVARGHNKVAPLKLNYIQLLNVVNANDFDLQQAADIIGRDTALTISLLGMVNRMTVNSGITSIRHAAAMLGQKELKRWINTAVAGELYADKPSEVTRLSLLRARFAENLAGSFGLAAKKEELFLMGLFSVLDVILEKSMKEALQIMKVADDIEQALVDKEGPLAPVYEFLLEYENANWQEVSRLMVLQNMSMDAVQNVYTEALEWYRNLITDDGKE